MNAHDVATFFDGASLSGVAPMLTLTVGVLLLLIIETLPQLAKRCKR